MPIKVRNEYSEQFGEVYPRIPKSVFAAVAFSLASHGEPTEGLTRFYSEWRTLHENGIVPQVPPVYRCSQCEQWHGGKPKGACPNKELVPLLAKSKRKRGR